ncbi:MULTISPECIES: helix-turn-helix domain-containing protein [Anaerotignum]|uniref:helix-turn-helix domain-containing protein n=1 Tax=Anaerotignum TaxID=2039240 RepID=UPI0028982D82|nr:helix-turn-helix domain-containing protein [Anaerotignum sp.]
MIILEESKLIIDRINALCYERGITVGRLCTMSGATGSTINDIMNGVTKNPGVFTIKKLCDGLGITLSEFFDTVEFKNSEPVVK